jgi:hypothetical protein
LASNPNRVESKTARAERLSSHVLQAQFRPSLHGRPLPDLVLIARLTPLVVQRRPASGAEPSGEPVLALRVAPRFFASLAGRVGHPLPSTILRKMETLFDADLSTVRIHVTTEPARIHALAFTTTDQIHMAPGLYQPHTRQGQRVLAHELAHVLQQRAGLVTNPLGAGFVVVQDAALEAEAERFGRLAAEPSVTLRGRGVDSSWRRGSSPRLIPPTPRTHLASPSFFTAMPGRLPPGASNRSPAWLPRALQQMQAPAARVTITPVDLVGVPQQSRFAAVRARCKERDRGARNYACVLNEDLVATNADRQEVASSDREYTSHDEIDRDPLADSGGHAERMAIKNWATKTLHGVNYNQDASVFGAACENGIAQSPLYVFTERPPCSGCTIWLNDFARRAKTNITVYHVDGLNADSTSGGKQWDSHIKYVVGTYVAPTTATPGLRRRANTRSALLERQRRNGVKVPTNKKKNG